MLMTLEEGFKVIIDVNENHLRTETGWWDS